MGQTETSTPPTSVPGADASIPDACIETDGDLHVRAASHVRESIHALGRVQIGAGASLHAGVSAGRDLVLDDGAHVEGPATTKGSLSWGSGASVDGCVEAGELLTADGQARAAQVRARHGIRSVPPEGDA